MTDQAFEILTQLSPVMIIMIIGLVLLSVAASVTSIGRAILPRSVTDAVSKLLPSALITDVSAPNYREFKLEVSGANRLKTVHVRRREGMTIAWTYDPALECAHAGTFAFTSFRHNLEPGSFLKPDESQARIEKSLIRVLAPKEFHPADPQTADITISVFGVIEGEVSLEELGDAFARSDSHEWKQALGTALRQDGEKDFNFIARGSLVLDVVDARSQNVLWRAAAVADVASNDSDTVRERRIEMAFSEMLKNFPHK